MKKTNQTLSSIVNILAHSDGYIDGTSIGEKLAISRNAVCKAITKLKVYGVKIESVKSKGYHLQEPLVLLEAGKIIEALNNNGIKVDILESIGSTNDYLKEFYGTQQTRVCIAEQQTHGKGRLNRNWHSPFGQNIYVSFLANLPRDISELGGLSLVIGFAVIKTLTHFNLPDGLIKWPNDILYNDRKLGGCLIEIQAEANGTCSVVIGVGLNVNMTTATNKQIDQQWTSMRQISKNFYDRNLLSAILINNLMEYTNKFSLSGLAPFVEQWKNIDYLFGKPVSIKSINTVFSGIACGINPIGQLLVKKGNKINTVSSGDASILKSS